MKNTIITLLLPVISLLLHSCDKDDNNLIPDCPDNSSLEIINERGFKMGFSTWSYGPLSSDLESTYQFILNNADIYSEQIDDKIPWSALINNTAYPTEFVNDIDYRVSKKMDNHQLLLSVSLLNALRTDIAEDFDGTVPSYASLNDKTIEDAYFQYLTYLVDRLQPDYLVLAMEVNELWINTNSLWNQYKLLMENIRARIKESYPGLPLSESITLHNWFNPDVTNAEEYIAELTNYIEQLDFAAISFYPFIKQLDTTNDFQEAFDFLHSKVNKPVAFVETAHLSEDLSVPSFDLFIEGSKCEQKAYVETLLLNAYSHNYEFVIWWAHRDYDQLLQSFPEELREVGSLWRDTGLLNEYGEERPSYLTWQRIFSK